MGSSWSKTVKWYKIVKADKFAAVLLVVPCYLHLFDGLILIASGSVLLLPLSSSYDHWVMQDEKKPILTLALISISNTLLNVLTRCHHDQYHSAHAIRSQVLKFFCRTPRLQSRRRHFPQICVNTREMVHLTEKWQPVIEDPSYFSHC